MLEEFLNSVNPGRHDPDLCEWLFGILGGKPHKAGDFPLSVADAALRADGETRILRPALLEFKDKYPKYRDTAAKV